MKKNIVIIILEGMESYTEVNFFEGLSYHFQKINFTIFGLEKTKKTKQINEKNKAKILKKCSGILEYNNNIYFYGDGDCKEDVPAMKNTQEQAMKIFKEFLDNNALNFNKEEFKSNDNFEKQIDFNFPKKSKGYKVGFNDFCKEKKLFIKNQELNKEKLLKYFEKRNQAKLIKFLCERV